MRHVIVLQDQLQLKETDRQIVNQSENPTVTERNSQKDDVYARIILCLHVDVGIHL